MHSRKDTELKEKASVPEKDPTENLNLEYDSSEACEENDHDSNSGQRLDKDEFDESTSECGSTQENVKLNKPCRTNSLIFDKNGNSSPIRYSDRNVTEESDVEKNPMKDAITVCVFSLEAGAKFHKEYHKNLKKNRTFNVAKSGDIQPITIRELTNKVDYAQVTNYAEAFAEFLRNKEPAHVVAVLEGSRSNYPRSFVTQDNQRKNYEYILQDFHLTGGDAVGRKDEKQSMNFYVRVDMVGVFAFNRVQIPVNTLSFVAAEVIFTTQKNGQKFAVNIVHIPNKFTTSQKTCDLVHEAFKKYAYDKAKGENVIVTCYVGDTNYKKVIQANSKPSYGGNQGKKYLSPTSSSASKHTDFMQSISLTKSPSVTLNQPSTLNHVELSSASQTTPVKTDHPSIQTTLLVDDKVVGKPKKISPQRRETKSENDLSINNSTELKIDDHNDNPQKSSSLP